MARSRGSRSLRRRSAGRTTWEYAPSSTRTSASHATALAVRGVLDLVTRVECRRVAVEAGEPRDAGHPPAPFRLHLVEHEMAGCGRELGAPIDHAPSARAVDSMGAPGLHAVPVHEHPRSGPRVARADEARQVDRRHVGVDPELLDAELVGVGRLARSAGSDRSCRGGAACRRAAACRAPRAARAARRPSPPRRSDVRTRPYTGPVSSPSSSCMTHTPVSSSPASIARSTGAAPRQRGSSEKWRFTNPCRVAARSSGGRSWPKATTTPASASSAAISPTSSRARSGVRTGRPELLGRRLHRARRERAASAAPPIGLCDDERDIVTGNDQRAAAVATASVGEPQ